MRRFHVAIGASLILAINWITPAGAFAQEARWATEDGVVGVAVPEGWLTVRARDPSTVLFLVSNEMQSDASAFGACSVSRDVVPVVGRTQDEANRVAADWATHQMSGYTDVTSDQAVVGNVSVVSFTGLIQQGATSYREFVRFLQIGAAQKSVSYMLSCRVGLTSTASDSAARRFMESLTVTTEVP